MTYLIEKSQCTILFGQITDLLDGPDTAAHRVDTLKSNDLGRFLRILFEFSLQIQEIVMLENDTFSTRVTHALDHRSMVHGIGEEDTTRKFSTEGRQSGIIGDVARRENQTSFFAMQGCDFFFQSQMHRTITSNIPGTTRTMTIFIQGTTAKSKLSSVEELVFE